MGLLDVDDSIVKPVTDMVGDLGKTAENLATDRNTIRQKIDSTSKFILPQIIRPLAFIWAMANETILTTAAIILSFIEDANTNGVTAIETALGANSLILMTIVGFYFKSRKDEKIAAKAAQANLEMKVIEHELEVKKEEMYLDREEKVIKMELKEQAKDNKKERRANRKPFFRRRS